MPKQKIGRTLKESIPTHIYSGENAELLYRLKQKRLTLAQDQGVPAFVVFVDTVLYQMVERKPKNRDDFLNLVGVGPAKLEKYGDSFLSVINNSWFIQSNTALLNPALSSVTLPVTFLTISAFHLHIKQL